MIVVTGATGQLGRLTLAALLRSVPASQIVAAVRNPAKAADLAALGVQVRQADYNQPASLDAALAGAKKVLLISSSEVGQREAQHRAAIEAAQRAKVELLAYTSILHADRSTLGLAREHQATEALLRASGLPVVLLRNGWYIENYTGHLEPALAHGAILGNAGDGRISAAARADYADAAAAVLTREGQAGQVYELAGDASFTKAELAAEVSRQAGQPVAYNNLSQAEHEAALVQAGLPPGFAALLADTDVGVANGALFDDSHQLSRLIGRPTTPLAAVVAAALKR
jgi:NAD(P)H dehydrogenase (quinone)